MSVDSHAMRRVLVIFIVLFGLLWQSTAMARLGSSVNLLADLEHAALHWLEMAHHHHDDGSYHEDDSPDSVQHVVVDPVNSTCALLTEASAPVFFAGSSSPGTGDSARPPDAPLQGLLRPPRSRS